RAGLEGSDRTRRRFGSIDRVVSRLPGRRQSAGAVRGLAVLFNSEPYLVFLPVVVTLNWVMPARLRPVFLLAASYYFYAFWNPPFLLLIFALTLANYFIGMAQGRQQPRRRSLVMLAVGVDLGALVIFKYLGLLDESARNLATLFHL